MSSLVFFGTQEFAASILEALLAAKKYQITGVVTQPDRPVGRGQAMTASPVKQLAEKHQLRIFQPSTLPDQNIPSADWFVVCQYGLIIPKTVLGLPKNKTINVHTSLLPKYRGASPIQTALINGETETGITIMEMDEKVDHGPILAQEKISIAPDDTYPTLSARMAPEAGKLLIETLTGLEADTIKPSDQNHDQATFCKILTRDDGKLDFTKTANQLYNQYRGTYPWPGVWTTWDNKRLKLLRIEASDRKLAPGVVAADKNEIFIGTDEGSIQVHELQLEGKKAMDAKTFLSGHQHFAEAKL